MNVLISATSTGVYRHLIKPVLFLQQPDRVHERLLRAGSRLQKVGLFRWTMQVSWAYRNPALLRQEYDGIVFENPVGLSAGFDKNFQLPLLMKAVGFGFMEGGSLTFKYCAGNPRPWFYRLPRTKSLVVYAGLGNEGAVRNLRRVMDYSEGVFERFPLNISVAKTNSPEAVSEEEAIADYLGSLGLIQSTGVGNMITLNISCPNTYGGEPFTTPDRLERLLAAVDGLKLDLPVYIKMPCDLPWEKFRALTAVAARHHVAGLTIANLAKDRAKVKLQDPLPDRIKGNLSGKPTWGLSNELIRRTRKEYGNRFTIIGVGGIFSAEDAYTKIRLGANLVELITGMIFEGPQLIGQINRGLVKLLERDGFTNVQEAVGADV